MQPLRSRYTPRNRSELVACLIGLGETRRVKVKATADELLRPYGVRTVKGALDLPAWPPVHRDQLATFDRGDDRAGLERTVRHASQPTSPSCRTCWGSQADTEATTFIALAVPPYSFSRSGVSRQTH